jgi:prevent-host-death family protein
MKYTVHQAKTNLSRLLEEASAGKEVIIARGKEPVAKLVAIGTTRVRREPGKLAGQIAHTPDAFAPLTDSELSDLGFE